MLCATNLDGAMKHAAERAPERFMSIYLAVQHAKKAVPPEQPLFFHYTLTGVLLPERNSVAAQRPKPSGAYIAYPVNAQKCDVDCTLPAANLSFASVKRGGIQ
jgi:hypothetical protein